MLDDIEFVILSFSSFVSKLVFEISNFLGISSCKNGFNC